MIGQKDQQTQELKAFKHTEDGELKFLGDGGGQKKKTYHAGKEAPTSDPAASAAASKESKELKQFEAKVNKQLKHDQTQQNHENKETSETKEKENQFEKIITQKLN